MAQVFLGIGSNEGDRLEQISSAIKRLTAAPHIRVTRMAPIVETPAVGGPPQPDFLNTVVEVETTHEPDALLTIMKTLERALGRVPSEVRWGPRPIDLDLLFYEDRILSTPGLTIPHPRLHERRFVLEPLAQLAPDLRHPILGRTIADLLTALES